MDKSYKKWTQLVGLYVASLSLIRLLLISLIDVKWHTFSMLWYVVFPFLIALLTWPLLKIHLSLRKIDALLILALALILSSSQIFLTHFLKIHVKQVESIEQVVEFPNYQYYQVSQTTHSLNIEDFEFTYKIKTDRKFSRRGRSIKEGLHFIGQIVTKNEGYPITFIYKKIITYVANIQLQQSCKMNIF